MQSSMSTLLSADEVYWRQRSHAIWLKEGDRNSKFFYRRASNRRKRNKIKGLFDHRGTWQTSPKGVEDAVLRYFQDVFNCSAPNVKA